MPLPTLADNSVELAQLVPERLVALLLDLRYTVKIPALCKCLDQLEKGRPLSLTGFSEWRI